MVSETVPQMSLILLYCVISSARWLSYDLMAPLFVAFGLREPHSEMIDAKSGGNGIPLRVRETLGFMQIICKQPR